MPWLLAILLVAVLVGSFYADYKWRQWIAARRAERDSPNGSGQPPGHRP